MSHDGDARGGCRSAEECPAGMVLGARRYRLVLGCSRTRRHAAHAAAEAKACAYLGSCGALAIDWQRTVHRQQPHWRPTLSGRRARKRRTRRSPSSSSYRARLLRPVPLSTPHRDTRSQPRSRMKCIGDSYMRRGDERSGEGYRNHVRPFSLPLVCSRIEYNPTVAATLLYGSLSAEAADCPC